MPSRICDICNSPFSFDWRINGFWGEFVEYTSGARSHHPGAAVKEKMPRVMGNGEELEGRGMVGLPGTRVILTEGTGSGSGSKRNGSGVT